MEGSRMTDHNNVQPKTPPDPRQDPVRWGARLERLLAEQRDLCARLDELSREQSEIVRQSDADALLKVLAERQSIVDRVSELNEQLQPFRARWEEFLAALDGPCRGRVERLVEELAALVAGVTGRDETDRAVLERRRSALSDEIKTVSRGQGAVAAYSARAGERGPRYQDTEG